MTDNITCGECDKKYNGQTKYCCPKCNSLKMRDELIEIELVEGDSYMTKYRSPYYLETSVGLEITPIYQWCTKIVCGVTTQHKIDLKEDSTYFFPWDRIKSTCRDATKKDKD